MGFSKPSRFAFDRFDTMSAPPSQSISTERQSGIFVVQEGRSDRQRARDGLAEFRYGVCEVSRDHAKSRRGKQGNPFVLSFDDGSDP